MIVIKSKNIKTIKWLYENAKSVILKILFLSLCTVFISYISVRFALESKTLLDKATQGGNIWLSIRTIALLIVFQLSVQIVYTMIHLHTETKFKNKISLKVFSSLFYKKYKDLNSYHSGELMNRINNDTGIISTNIMSVIPNLVAFLSRIVLGFVALYSIDSSFALVFLVIGPFVMIMARVYSKKVKPLHKQCLSRQGKTQSFMLETLQNILVVKSFSAHKRIEKEADLLQRRHLKVIMKRGYISIFANILFFISLTIGYYFAVGWCAYKISLGVMTVGTFAAIIQLVGQVQTPFKELASVIPQVYATYASAERLMELENLPDEKMKYINADIENIYNSMKSINVCSLSFSYDDEPVFDSADVKIEKGKLTAINGLSGIGKSTLLKLILAILESDKGGIEFEMQDGTLYDADASLRPLFAYVPQGNMIISGSIRKNIGFMSEDADEEKIIHSAKIACIYDVIKSLPDGLDTELGEGGAGLSEGQLQRLAVARAVCSDAPILLLDEATSALDEKTEEEMLKNLKSLDGRTCISISHKECALGLSDAILTVKDGKIIKNVQL